MSIQRQQKSQNYLTRILTQPLRMLQGAIVNMLKANEKKIESQKRNRKYKGKPNGNFRTKKQVKNYTVDGLNSKQSVTGNNQ